MDTLSTGQWHTTLAMKGGSSIYLHHSIMRHHLSHGEMLPSLECSSAAVLCASSVPLYFTLRYVIEVKRYGKNRGAVYTLYADYAVADSQTHEQGRLLRNTHSRHLEFLFNILLRILL